MGRFLKIFEIAGAECFDGWMDDISCAWPAVTFFYISTKWKYLRQVSGFIELNLSCKLCGKFTKVKYA